MAESNDPAVVVLEAPPVDKAAYPDAVLTEFPEWVVTVTDRWGREQQATQMNVRYADDGTASVVLPPGVEATDAVVHDLNALAVPSGG